MEIKKLNVASDAISMKIAINELIDAVNELQKPPKLGEHELPETEEMSLYGEWKKALDETIEKFKQSASRRMPAGIGYITEPKQQEPKFDFKTGGGGTAILGVPKEPEEKTITFGIPGTASFDSAAYGRFLAKKQQEPEMKLWRTDFIAKDLGKTYTVVGVAPDKLLAIAYANQTAQGDGFLHTHVKCRLLTEVDGYRIKLEKIED